MKTQCQSDHRSSNDTQSMSGTKELWADALSQTWHGARHWLAARTVDRLPVVVVRRRIQQDRELSAFQYGVEAQRLGLVDPADEGRRGH